MMLSRKKDPVIPQIVEGRDAKLSFDDDLSDPEVPEEGTPTGF